jgi:Rrf2 family protein
MIELALQHGGDPVQLRKIAWNQGISEKYLEHLIRVLRERGLVLSSRGARGGYALVRDPAGIRLSEIFEALDGQLDLVSCVDRPGECPRSSACATRRLWGRMARAMWDVLEGMTLAELVEMQGDEADAQADMYYI